MRSPRQRLLVSFVVSPLVALPIMACASLLFQLWLMTTPVERFQEGIEVEAILVGGLLALLVAYPVMLVLGIPITLALRKLNLFRPLVMVPLGVLAGAAPFLPFSNSPDSTVLQVTGGLSGAVTAWLVWRISSGGPLQGRTGAGMGA